MKTIETIKIYTDRYLEHMQKEYERDPDKTMNCVAFHLFQAAIKASVLNPKYNEVLDDIVNHFKDPRECPERLADIDSCPYSQFLDNYASEIMTKLKDGDH